MSFTLVPVRVGGVDYSVGISLVDPEDSKDVEACLYGEAWYIAKGKSPQMSKAWYKTKERSIRKERTIDIVSFKYNINITDNDVADAIGIGMFAIENWDKVTNS